MLHWTPTQLLKCGSSGSLLCPVVSPLHTVNILWLHTVLFHDVTNGVDEKHGCLAQHSLLTTRDLLFADDTLLVGETTEVLQFQLDTIVSL